MSYVTAVPEQVLHPEKFTRYQDHAERLVQSFKHWTGRSLLSDRQIKEHNNLLEALYFAPFALCSHGGEKKDPIFNFGNQAALELFELSWDDFIVLPSRQSAEPISQAERAEMLQRVTQHGYIDDYGGIRISATGKRFEIRNAIVWNIIDPETREYFGQAAKFDEWESVE